MALPANCSIPLAGRNQLAGSSLQVQQVAWRASSRKNIGTVALCDASSSAQEPAGGKGISELKIGSPVIIVEAPPTLKTVNSISALRINAGLVKPGDVGRIVARRPKDVWAVRLAIGSYLIEGKHFKPLDLEEDTV